MPTPRIIKDQANNMYFVTFTVHNWYYIFDRHNRFKILEDSFVYCQQNKSLEIFAFVFMLNHLHFIGRAPDLIGVIRDMKKFLSKEMQKNIIATEPEALNLFKIRDNEYRFWKDGNYSERIETVDFLEQKINYIHNNPVRREYVNYSEDWRWSSASKTQTKIRITNI